ncbi:DUF1963 domain-containing protein [Deinococcus sonorensis]
MIGADRVSGRVRRPRHRGADTRKMDTKLHHEWSLEAPGGAARSEAMSSDLEFSDTRGGHECYAVTVDGVTLRLRYGRIGTDGAVQLYTFPTRQAAEEEAVKRLAETRRNGYEPAVKGDRQQPSVPRLAWRLPNLLNPCRDAPEATVRTYVHLEGKRGPGPAWTSKLGGRPCRPPGDVWPLAHDGTPLVFLAQIDFAEFPPLPGFPERGIVQYFIWEDDLYGANFDRSLDMTSLAVDANVRVRYFADVIKDAKRLDHTVPDRFSDPDGSLPHDPTLEFILVGTLRSGPVTSDDRLLEQLTGSSLWALSEDVHPDDLAERYARLTGTGHKLGGYPTFTPADPRRVEDPQVLLQSDDDLALMWGTPASAISSSTRTTSRADFSRVAYNWVCS